MTLRSENPTCVVCGARLNAGPFYPIPDRRISYYPCPRCGDFRISWEADSDVGGLLRRRPGLRPILSHGIRQLRRVGGEEPPLILSEVASRILEQKLPTPVEQVDNLVLWLGEEGEAGGTGKPADIPYPFAAGIIGCADGDGVKWTVQTLEEEGMIRRRDVHRTRQVFIEAGKSEPEEYEVASTLLTLKGWRRYEELKRAVVQSRVAFMAMPFGDAQLDAVFANCFKPAVEHTGFDLHRLTDQQRAGLIDDRLRVEIRRSRFLLCELTQDNRGAYWEAGFAEGLGRPVIYTCRKDHHIQVHFDTNHYLTVLWEPDKLDEASTELKAVIRATLPTEAKQADE